MLRYHIHESNGEVVLWDARNDRNLYAAERNRQLLTEAAHALNNLEPLRAALDAAARLIVSGSYHPAQEQAILAQIDKALADSKA